VLDNTKEEDWKKVAGKGRQTLPPHNHIITNTDWAPPHRPLLLALIRFVFNCVGKK